MSIKINRTAIAVTIALTSLQAHSAGFQVSEHSASGLGRAFAGEAAIADNASVIARNPAAMMMFDSAQISAAGSIVDPNIDVKDHAANQTAKDVAPLSFVPAGYYVQPINEKFAFGLALFTNYGVTTEYPTDFASGDLAGKTSLITINLNPSVAYRINDQFSIGGGVSLVYADAELNRHLGRLAPLFSGSPEDKLISMEGDTWDWSWNVGALYEVNEDHRFGVSYRSQVSLEFEGEFTDYEGTIIEPKQKGSTAVGSLPVVLPAIAEFSGYHSLTKEFAVHYSVQWTQWSKFEELKATNDKCNYNGMSGVCFMKDEKYEDNFRWAIGGTYRINPEWTVRTGFAFDEQAGKPTLSIPDSDRYWYSAGATWAYSSQLSVDVGVTYIHGTEGTFTEDSSAGELTFTSTGGAVVGAAQMNYSF
ncbi:outer membrane protein transport protein [Photobacterium sanguinicancri]|uniref:Outer membrane protein transport protein n=1 Tax=Photobacterium sanguinicancri TaxID=875932 RepID=A0AAW7Y2N5_9GAMM|nr:outer membrane protein transport protein [Photobacterium sanguinicancri]KXI22224.1 long-chain fatty acid outer membrane transporter [Photobacterium sanguinicancri]MDO6542611.1 outer membrane protein transport protein [Photobacterium sanguinicancri]